MTSVQVQYWANKEQQRHNMATEGETYRHNVVTENQNQQSITEVARHNRATEDIQYGNLFETKRHNLATEKEVTRHNVATENEAVRHNVATEAIGRTQATASMIQAEAARRNAKTNEDRLIAENTLRAAQLEYQNLTNEAQAAENAIWLDDYNQEVKYFFSSIGSALGGLTGPTNAAGGLFSAVVKAFT